MRKRARTALALVRGKSWRLKITSIMEPTGHPVAKKIEGTVVAELPIRKDLGLVTEEGYSLSFYLRDSFGSVVVLELMLDNTGNPALSVAPALKLLFAQTSWQERPTVTSLTGPQVKSGHSDSCLQSAPYWAISPLM